jgi:hypothetical protein
LAEIFQKVQLVSLCDPGFGRRAMFLVADMRARDTKQGWTGNPVGKMGQFFFFFRYLAMKTVPAAPG